MRMLLGYVCGAAGVLAAAWAATPQVPPARSYVHVSRVPLRSEPADSAPIAGYVTTNTEVDVRSRKLPWCDAFASSSGIRGFVRCDTLGSSPLTLADIEARAARPGTSAADVLEWRSRAFWAFPSLRRFELAGVALERALLADDHERERPGNDAFDAMKARLRSGTVATAHRVSNVSIEYLEPPIEAAMKREPRPAIRPSFFRSEGLSLAIALGPFSLNDSGELAPALVDALSATAQVPFTATPIDAAYVAHFGVVGIWDVSTVGVKFQRSATVYGITARGLRTGIEIASLVVPVGDHGCAGREVAIDGRPTNGSWASAIVGWVGKPPPGANAVVTVRNSGGPGRYEKVEIHTVDLDADKVSDFFILAGRTPAVVEEGDKLWKAVFANVDGTWLLAAFRQTTDCT